MELTIFGSASQVARQTPKLATLATQYGYQIGGDGPMQAWEPGAGIDGYMCNHVEVIGLVAGVQGENGQRFLVEAMKLPGVYQGCPEHNKRRFWEEQEAKLPALRSFASEEGGRERDPERIDMN
jgi:hypothetical protein